MRSHGVIAAVGIVLLAWTSVTAQEAKPGSAANGAGNAEEYRIGPEDVLQVFVWKNETLSRSVSVRPDGKVSVIGEVSKPGRYELKSRTTVLDVVALAGGFGPFASRAKMAILRPDGGKMKRIPFNFNKAISEGGEQENFYVLPNDIVVVP
jgi:polysaccharide export outer membrane protein